MPVEPGEQISHYRIVEKIGEGGMGAVYLAINLRLESEVAVKVLRDDALGDAEARRRFQKEARALSRLNHPNIAIVHDFDTHSGVDFIVMEYVSGETLHDRIASGRLSEEECRDLSLQLVAGMEAAHRCGVVHRDLKPRNIRVTPDRRLKILDFGLARVIQPSSASATTQTLTEKQTLIGTLPYMAPELLRGESANVQSDIYACGLVFYEMSTGRHPFASKLVTNLIDDILHRPPPAPREFNPDLSPAFEAIILKAIDKKPEQRYPSISALGVALKLTSSDSIDGGSTKRFPARWRPWMIPVAMLVVAVVFLVSQRWRGERKEPWLGIPKIEPLITWSGQESDSRISPDQQWVSFSAENEGRRALWRRQLSGGDPEALVSHEGNLISHVWSADGLEIALLVYQVQNVYLQYIASFGGPVKRSTKLPARFMDGILRRWIGSHLYIDLPSEGLWRLNTETEQIELLIPAKLGGARRGDFDVCTDESQVVFTMHQMDRSTLWTSALDASHAVPITSEEHSDFRGRWLGPGCETVVFSSNRSGQADLWSLSLPSRAAKQITLSINAELIEDTSTQGPMFTFKENQETSHLWMLNPLAHPVYEVQLTADELRDFWPDVSQQTSRLVFQRSKPRSERGTFVFDSRILLSTIDADGLAPLRQVAEDGGGACLSPNAQWLAYIKRAAQRGFELWMVDLRSMHSWRVTENVCVPALYTAPLDWYEGKMAWHPEGQELYFARLASPSSQELLRFTPSAQESAPEKLAEGERIGDLQISSDGRYLAYVKSQTQGAASGEIEVKDLVTGAEETWFRHVFDGDEDLSCTGWTGRRSLLVLSVRRNEDWSENVTALAVDQTAVVETLAVVNRCFAGTAVLDADRRALYVTKSDENGVHNVYAVDLSNGELSRLTSNKIKGYSFSGLEVLRDGSLLFCRQEKNDNIRLVRFED